MQESPPETTAVDWPHPVAAGEELGPAVQHLMVQPHRKMQAILHLYRPGSCVR